MGLIIGNLKVAQWQFLGGELTGLGSWGKPHETQPPCPWLGAHLEAGSHSSLVEIGRQFLHGPFSSSDDHQDIREAGFLSCLWRTKVSAFDTIPLTTIA